MSFRLPFNLGLALMLALPAIVQAASAPAITTQPAPVSVAVGKTATFTVTATGTATLKYQWRRNGTNISGATARTYTSPVTTTADNGAKFQVYITNSYGAITSKSALLTVTSPSLSITTQPTAQTVTAPAAATFSVTATGSNLSYQWKKNGVAISGATSAAYTTPATTSSDSGASFLVTVSNGVTSINSQSALLTVNTPLSITSQPVAQTVAAPAAATFSVTATGSNLSYQWKKNGAAIAGATGASYTTPATTSADNGASFLVTISNGVTSISSQNALLTVTSSAFGITRQPQSQTAIAPEGATFTVVASGSNLGYQWRKNGAAISGATNASYTLSATDLQEISAQFSVVVSSGGSTATSENATLTVMAPNPTYAGDPVAVPNRPVTVLPSYTLGAAFPNGSFRFGYDEGLKNPLWTAYANFKFMTAFPNGTRNFVADDRLASPQVTDADYSGSGWTRGHQVMMSDLAYRYGAQAGTDTCRLSNIAPQSATHNNNFWNNLEQVVGGSNPATWVPGLADKFNRIWIYTGPIFDANPTRMGSKSIAIPSGFYKVIVREAAPGQPKALAILAPHATVPPNADLWKYVTSVARVEELTKLNLFPQPSSPLPVAFTAQVDVRGWGAPFEQTAQPNVHIVEPSWDITIPVGTPLNFRGDATSSASTIASVAWNFGDGTTANTPNATRTYASSGSFTVTFTAKDALGVSTSLTRVVTVN